jgi:queuine tRNA-ribosyltransferase
MYSKSYLRHLFNINEYLGKEIATIHNLGFYSWIIEESKLAIKEDRFFDWKNQMVGKLNNKL